MLCNHKYVHICNFNIGLESCVFSKCSEQLAVMLESPVAIMTEFRSFVSNLEDQINVVLTWQISKKTTNTLFVVFLTGCGLFILAD